MIVDLHVHTGYSFDSLSRPEDVVRAARRKDLDGIAITDHNDIRGALRARAHAAGTDFIVIVGEEIATNKGDIIALFLVERIAPGPLEMVVEAIHRQGGLVVLPHPYRGHEPTDQILSLVDAVESFNGRTKELDNERSSVLAIAYDKPGISVSDAHFCSEVGNSAIQLSENDIREAILHRQFRTVSKYNPSYLFPLSQIVKSLKQRECRNLPKQAAWMIARLAKVR